MSLPARTHTSASYAIHRPTDSAENSRLDSCAFLFIQLLVCGLGIGLEYCMEVPSSIRSGNEDPAPIELNFYPLAILAFRVKCIASKRP